MDLLTNIKMLIDYKAWANQLTFSTALGLSEKEVLKKRPTRFKSIVNTLNHVYVIDDIFKAHLTGKQHGYAERNTLSHPSLIELWDIQKTMDSWYVSYTAALSNTSLYEVVPFTFVDGSKGSMTRLEILQHIVNHGTYHRGFVGDMFYQIPVSASANDLPVFIREKQNQQLHSLS